MTTSLPGAGVAARNSSPILQRRRGGFRLFVNLENMGAALDDTIKKQKRHREPRESIHNVHSGVFFCRQQAQLQFLVCI